MNRRLPRTENISGQMFAAAGYERQLRTSEPVIELNSLGVASLSRAVLLAADELTCSSANSDQKCGPRRGSLYMGSAKSQLLKAVQHRNRNGAVRSRRNLPGKLASAHRIGAHLCSVILIGKGSAIDVEGDRMLNRVHAVCSKVDARAETSFFVLFRSSLELVSRGKLQALCTIDLNRIMTIGCEDDKAVRVIAVIRSARAIGQYLVRSGYNPCADNGGRLCRSGESRDAEKREKRAISDLHAANVATNQEPHNLILLNASLSAIYLSPPGWQRCR